MKQRLRLSGPLRFCAAVWLGQRLLLQGLGLLLVAVAGPPAHSRPGFFGTYFNWDSGWFACIAQSGYFGPPCQNGDTVARRSFFPLYPEAGRALSWVLGTGRPSEATLTAALWLVPAVCSLVAAVLLHLLVEDLYGVAVARRAVVCLLLGPYAVFLLASYSEALYLATAIGAWYLCQRRCYLAAGLVGILATASRASGLFLTPALLVLCVTAATRAGARVRIRDLLAVASSGLGLLGYWGWLALRTGDPLAWFDAQRLGWNRHSQWPWQTLYRQGIHVLFEPRWDRQLQAVLEVVFAVVLCVAVLVFLRRREWAFATLVGLTAVSFLTSNSYQSLARNTLTLFPLAILLALLPAYGRRRAYGVLLGVSALLMLVNAALLATGHWAD